MRNSILIASIVGVLWLFAASVQAAAGAPGAAARTKPADRAAAAVIAPAAYSPTHLAAAPAKDRDEIKVPKDKPKKSKKNGNDGKDDDPDDGNAGGGNDERTLPNDGPEKD